MSGFAREGERFAAKRIQGENCYEGEGAGKGQGNQGGIENELNILYFFIFYIRRFEKYLYLFIPIRKFEI